MDLDSILNFLQEPVSRQTAEHPILAAAERGVENLGEGVSHLTDRDFLSSVAREAIRSNTKLPGHLGIAFALTDSMLGGEPQLPPRPEERVETPVRAAQLSEDEELAQFRDMLRTGKFVANATTRFPDVEGNRGQFSRTGKAMFDWSEMSPEGRAKSEQRRQEQARFVAKLVPEIISSNPGVPPETLAAMVGSALGVFDAATTPGAKRRDAEEPPPASTTGTPASAPEEEGGWGELLGSILAAAGLVAGGRAGLARLGGKAAKGAAGIAQQAVKSQLDDFAAAASKATGSMVPKELQKAIGFIGEGRLGLPAPVASAAVPALRATGLPAQLSPSTLAKIVASPKDAGALPGAIKDLLSPRIMQALGSSARTRDRESLMRALMAVESQIGTRGVELLKSIL